MNMKNETKLSGAGKFLPTPTDGKIARVERITDGPHCDKVFSFTLNLLAHFLHLMVGMLLWTGIREVHLQGTV